MFYWLVGYLGLGASEGLVYVVSTLGRRSIWVGWR